jgi:hypothetical protein
MQERDMGEEIKPLEETMTEGRSTGHTDEVSQGEIPADWLAEFEAAARRSLQVRMRYAFIRTYKPVLDDAPYRAFDTMEDYRRWCEENLPEWLGYARV